MTTSATTTSATDHPRNVLVIMTDQHRVDTIGALLEPGAKGVHTPNIDRLASEGSHSPRR